jgi:hypothetical protein
MPVDVEYTEWERGNVNEGRNRLGGFRREPSASVIVDLTGVHRRKASEL